MAVQAFKVWCQYRSSCCRLPFLLTSPVKQFKLLQTAKLRNCLWKVTSIRFFLFPKVCWQFSDHFIVYRIHKLWHWGLSGSIGFLLWANGRITFLIGDKNTDSIHWWAKTNIHTMVRLDAWSAQENKMPPKEKAVCSDNQVVLSVHPGALKLYFKFKMRSFKMIRGNSVLPKDRLLCHQSRQKIELPPIQFVDDCSYRCPNQWKLCKNVILVCVKLLFLFFLRYCLFNHLFWAKMKNAHESLPRPALSPPSPCFLNFSFDDLQDHSLPWGLTAALLWSPRRGATASHCLHLVWRFIVTFCG